MEEAANLPAIITSQGGELVKVLLWPQHVAALNRQQVAQIGMLVRRHPELNTETGVDLLAEAAGFYGEQLDKWFAGRVGELGIETVMFAIETLHEMGHDYDPGEENVKERRDGRAQLAVMLELIVFLRESGEEIESVSRLNWFIERLGGWYIVVQLDREHLAEIVSGGLDTATVQAVIEHARRRRVGLEDDVILAQYGEDEDQDE